MDRLVIKRGTTLYRGINQYNKNNLLPEPIWFALSVMDAKHYGEPVVKYILQEDIVLFDPMTPEFQNIYMNLLNYKYTGTNSDGIDQRKLDAAIPLGLPDYNTQLTYLASKTVLVPKPTSWRPEFEMASACLNNKHRYSEFSRDLHMVRELKDIFGSQYDGYITRLKWPSKFHNGLLLKEICLFSNAKVKLLQGGNRTLLNKTNSKVTRKKQKGGVDPLYDHLPPGETWNKHAWTWDKEMIDAIDKQITTNCNTNIKYIDPYPSRPVTIITID
jgi:hypothetical protein